MYKSSQEFIEDIRLLRREVLSKDALIEALEEVGNPQEKLSCIHIAGTNGKGSTTSTIFSILHEAGYTIGTFTSPSLVSHHDMICVNQKPIAEESFVSLTNRYGNICVNKKLSFFEAQVFFAFLYFVEQKVDYVILEVGLGGIDDATNVMVPKVSVITNIGMDHLDYLGNSKKEIARAKAGIIKSGIPLVTMEKDSQCLQVFKEICLEKKSPFIVCENPKNVFVDKKLHFDYKNYIDIQENTLAKYQAYNASLAIETIEQLSLSIEKSIIRKGILGMKWPARFEQIQEHPRVILDGAHNEEGVEALVESCKDILNLHILFTALRDKPNHSMLESLCTISKNVTVCEFEHERADRAINIAKDYPVRVIADWKEAYETICQEVKDGTLLICGSLYFLSQIRAYILEKEKS
ncbi:MAG: folylpolyglutamate synthase/dihydrofolate synthase family protein [Bacillota bacterium]|nr:folylpolyglutamate synthase/dihydrofolate synthase family protein [Bacillota bacterium]